MRPAKPTDITFFVDEDEYHSDSKSLTVRQILEISGNIPADQYCLYLQPGQGQPHKYDSLDFEVHLHNGIRFSPLYCGETPYSDGTASFGSRRLLEELGRVGVRAEGPFPSQGAEELVLVPKYPVRFGRFLGREISIAVPTLPDFPASAPRGLFVSPALLPSGVCGIGDPGAATAALPGDGWLYWSRPIPQDRWRANRLGTSLIRHWDTVLADERFYAA
jgi:hypothetical protein